MGYPSAWHLEINLVLLFTGVDIGVVVTVPPPIFGHDRPRNIGHFNLCLSPFLIIKNNTLPQKRSVG
jgi:hypothetical protein